MSEFAVQPPPAPAPIPRHRHRWLRDAVEVLLIALILYVVIWNALQTVRVDGSSMEGTLHNSDLLLASKISYLFGTPQRGDIVILIPPIDPNKDFIKRVVGVPGDVLEIDDGRHDGTARVLIKPGGSGPFESLNEPYIAAPWLQNAPCCDASGFARTSVPTPVTVPPNQYFVMGDNRDHSEDSRYFGFVARDKILAKAIVRVWPPFKFGLGPGPTLIPALLLALPWLRFRRRIH